MFPTNLLGYGPTSFVVSAPRVWWLIVFGDKIKMIHSHKAFQNFDMYTYKESYLAALVSASHHIYSLKTVFPFSGAHWLEAKMAEPKQSGIKDNRWSLHGKTALVTGGTRGIGFVISSCFNLLLSSHSFFLLF